jgi:hypothetical protein
MAKLLVPITSIGPSDSLRVSLPYIAEYRYAYIAEYHYASKRRWITRYIHDRLQDLFTNLHLSCFIFTISLEYQE